MSIINQALRDLDARSTDAEAASTAATPTPVPRSASSRRGLWAVLFLLLVVAALALWLVLKPAAVSPPERGVLAHATPRAAEAVSVPEAIPVVAPEAVPLPEQPAVAEAASSKTLVVPQPPPVISKAETARPEQVPPLQASSSPAIEAPVEARTPPPRQPQAAPFRGDKVAAISKEIKKQTQEEEADDRYRKALSLVSKGRENQARPLLEEAVRLVPGHVAARQVLATLLNESGLNREAEAVLSDGRATNPENAWFAQSLARLQAARGDLEGAAASLRGGIDGRGVNAEYHASYAAILSRLKRPAEAAGQYELALKQQPDQGAWWMGLGLARSALGQMPEARAAYGRALAAGNLPEKLEDFVRTKLAE